MRLCLGKFLTDETFLDQNRALKGAETVEFDPVKRLSKRHVNVCKSIAELLHNLCQLSKIGTPRERHPHQIACETHTAREHNIGILPLCTKP